MSTNEKPLEKRKKYLVEYYNHIGSTSYMLATSENIISCIMNYSEEALLKIPYKPDGTLFVSSWEASSYIPEDIICSNPVDFWDLNTIKMLHQNILENGFKVENIRTGYRNLHYLISRKQANAFLYLMDQGYPFPRYNSGEEMFSQSFRKHLKLMGDK